MCEIISAKQSNMITSKYYKKIHENIINDIIDKIYKDANDGYFYTYVYKELHQDIINYFKELGYSFDELHDEYNVSQPFCYKIKWSNI